MSEQKLENIIISALKNNGVYGTPQTESIVAQIVRDIKANPLNALVRQAASSSDVLLAEIDRNLDLLATPESKDLIIDEDNKDYYLGKWAAYNEMSLFALKSL